MSQVACSSRHGNPGLLAESSDARLRMEFRHAMATGHVTGAHCHRCGRVSVVVIADCSCQRCGSVVTAEVALPAFAMGGRPTRVVMVGAEFAAIYDDTGEAITALTNKRMEDAAHHARVAAEQSREQDDEADHVGF